MASIFDCGAGNTGSAGNRVTAGPVPPVPATDGDVWFDTTAGAWKTMVNGTWVSVSAAGIPAATAAGQALVSAATTGYPWGAGQPIIEGTF